MASKHLKSQLNGYLRVQILMQQLAKFFAFVCIAILMFFLVISEYVKENKGIETNCANTTSATVVGTSANNSLSMLTFEYKCKNQTILSLANAPLFVNLGDKFSALMDTCNCTNLQVDYTKPIFDNDELVVLSWGTVFEVKQRPLSGWYFVGFEFKTKSGKRYQGKQHINKTLFNHLIQNKTAKKYRVLYALENPKRNCILWE